MELNTDRTTVATSLQRDIVVVGASTGGVQALRQLVAGLPADYRGSVFIVMHVQADAKPYLPAILSGHSKLPAVLAEDGMAIEPGRIYVAPPDRHLLVEPGRMRVVHGPRENRSRPAIDPLFRSAAWAYGPRVVGVVLTGRLDDGTAGLWAIKSCGGTTIVQEPSEAEAPDMPSSALMHNRIDHRLPLESIPALLAELALGAQAEAEAAGAPAPKPPPQLKSEIEFSKLQGGIAQAQALGALSPFTCPTCRGALWELDEGGDLRYRCHTGHAFSHPSLLQGQTAEIEESLYSALRAVEEKAAALRRLGERLADRIPGLNKDYEQRAQALDDAGAVLKALLAGAPP
jgi:two-component system chemotaxis response regulator CheB